MRAIVLWLMVMLTSSLLAGDLARFFKQEKGIKEKIRLDYSIDFLQPIGKKSITDSTYNECIELNNEALNEIKKGNFKTANQLLLQAISINPSEKSLWNNRYIALSNLKGYEKDEILVGRMLMAFEPNSHKHPYNIAHIYNKKLSQPEKAIAYLEHARKLEPNNLDVIFAMENCLVKIKNAEYQRVEFLNQTAHLDKTGYLYYQLGLLYLDVKDYTSSIKALEKAIKLDNKGFSHYAYIRARFLAGQLEGLKSHVEQTLRRFPKDKNEVSARKILRSLSNNDYKFIETVNINIKSASKLGNLSLYYKDIPSFQNKQESSLIRIELTSKGKKQQLSPMPVEGLPGVLKIPIERSWLSPHLKLTIEHRIKVAPSFSMTFKDPTFNRDINKMKKHKELGIHNATLNRLFRRIEALPGNFIVNAVRAVTNGLEYRENGQEHPVDWILKNPDHCDCTEYSLLLMALCLKKGYPVRMVSGFLSTVENWAKETPLGHAWCEVYLENKGWVPIDPTLFEKMGWAYFGNLLSDQIIFSHMELGAHNSRMRARYDTIPNSGAYIEMSNSYKITDWR